MKPSFLKTVLVYILLIFLIGCSTENNVSENNLFIASENLMMRQESSQVTAYLADFYKTTTSKITYGEDVETINATTTYVITEIIVDEDLEARGYVATEKNSGDFLYFVDVDRENYILTAIDIILNVEKTFDDIDKNDNYSTTDGYDFIKIVNDVNNGILSKPRFWGSGSTTCTENFQGFGTNGIAYCQTTCKTPYYVFWIDVSGGPYPVGGLHECP